MRVARTAMWRASGNEEARDRLFDVDIIGLTHLRAEAEASSVKQVEGAKAELERATLEVYRTMPPMVLLGLAAKELGGKLERIEHLNLSPDLFGPMLADLLRAGTQRLEGRD